MRLRFLLFILAIFLVEKAFSQRNQISLNLKDVTIEKIIFEIEKQSEYRFFFEQSGINLQAKTSVQIWNSTIKEVLEKVFNNTPYSYQIIDHHIILSQDKSVTWNNMNSLHSRIITGKVSYKNGEEIPGVTVILKNTLAGTVTDRLGHYRVEVPFDVDTLIFSYVGMKRENVAIGKKKQIDVTLDADILGVDEVVVVGYGDQRKSDLTGAITTIEVEGTRKMPVAGFDQALQGRAAGVLVTSTSGSPGGGTSVRIRGIGTVNNNNPLFVVDGIPTDDIRFLNMGDIDNVEILKDASATAIYGNRGANGVILINTKKGKAGSPVVTAESYIGVSDVWKNPNMGDSRQFVTINNLAVENGNKTEGDGAYQYIEEFKYPENYSGGTNWWKLITHQALVNNQNLSISGGTDVNKYLMSLSYLNQNGTIKGSEFERITFRVNNEYKLSDRTNIAFNTNFSRAKRETIQEDDLDGGIVFTALVLDPITSGGERPVDDPIRVKYGEFSRWYESIYSNKFNPVAQIGRSINTWTQLRFFGNLSFDYDLSDHLTYHTTFGLDIRHSDLDTFSPSYWMDSDSKNDINSVTRDQGKNTDWVYENMLTYKRIFRQNQSFTALLGMTTEAGKYELVHASKRNIPGNSDYLRYLSAAISDPNVTGEVSDYALISYLGRVNYSLNSQYLLTASIRADGSSKFAKGEKWGYFPSISGGWRLSSEKFFNTLKISRVVDDLKIRLGWGQVGNQNISDNAFRTLIVGGISNRYLFDQTIAQGYAPANIGNARLTWETTESTNIGIDYVLYNNKLSGSIDFYNKRTKNMLLRLPVPLSTGLPGSPWTNAGDVENKGFEFFTTYRNKWRDLNYSINFNISSYRNRIISLGGGEPIMGGEQRLGYTTKTMVGHPIGEFFGYIVEGVFQNQAEVDAANALSAVGEYYQDILTRPGDFKFRDLNDDGKITGEDRGFIGSPHPDFTYGINLFAEYHRFDFTLFLQGNQGGDIFNVFKYYTHQNTGYFNAPANMPETAWHGEGTSNTQFQISASTANNNLRSSSWYIEDGSFLRIKNVQIGFNLSKWFCQKIGISECRIYIGGQNLYTFTKYSGLDPELADLNGSPLSAGIDFAKYPQARTILTGLSVKF
ncbi:MAG: TonB-dependent receptor [Prolixibacteraceae bacterium]|jgi:TonB-linked SusC/RagA family outer membrane protein